MKENTPPNPDLGRILVCGATGYVGGRLVRRLLSLGYAVRCIVRSPAKLQKFSWRNHPRLEVVAGDLENVEQIKSAAEGTDVAYYLVHSMIVAGSKYEQRDRKLAENFVLAADHAGIERIIYLGGLGETGPGLSRHLRSRREVAAILRRATASVTTLRAAMIIGSGSASFEILRYLVERLPVMVTPIWVRTETQPIAIRDVLRYLTDCLVVSETSGETIDIGCPEVVTYRHLFNVMSDELRLRRRLIIPVPILSPRLSSYWIGYVTPVSNSIARPLAEGLRNRTVCRDDRAQRLMPGPLWNVQQAIEAAVGRVRQGDVETRWSTAGVMPGDPDWAGGTTLQDKREIVIDAPPSAVFAEIQRIGGQHGYWGADFLWHLRGWMDQLVGGPGLRRGRRDAEELNFGETVDFWRVTEMEPGRVLKLRAEMKLPDIAELLFRVQPIGDGEPEGSQTGDGERNDGDRNARQRNARQRDARERDASELGDEPERSRVRLHARFRPKGLSGLAYWYSVLPLHNIVFPMMLRGIRRGALKRRRSTEERAAAA